MRNAIKTYKDLLIWKKGLDLVKSSYRICSALPIEEKYGLQSQIRRATISIPANIAEGYGRESKKSYLQFLKISRGSLYELETLMIVAKDLDYIESSRYTQVSALITEESKMLNAYIRSLN